MSEETTSRVVAVVRGVENAQAEGPKRGSHHEALDVWIGRWINQGHMVEDDGRLGLTITTSDVYEWAPGGFFVLHTAYGRIGNFGAGGVEIIGFDETTGNYISYFFDSQSNVTTSTLVRRGDTWTYQGESTRSTVEFGESNHVQTVVHERTNDGQSYGVSMKVTLTRVE
jgi:Protein of unknown function (DUF1579)